LEGGLDAIAAGIVESYEGDADENTARGRY
jgi:hypothetical protein